jgi:hypothetical protein
MVAPQLVHGLAFFSPRLWRPTSAIGLSLFYP